MHRQDPVHKPVLQTEEDRENFKSRCPYRKGAVDDPSTPTFDEGTGEYARPERDNDAPSEADSAPVVPDGTDPNLVANLPAENGADLTDFDPGFIPAEDGFELRDDEDPEEAHVRFHMERDGEHDGHTLADHTDGDRRIEDADEHPHG